MRMNLQDAREDFSKAIRAIRDGRQVLLTDDRMPIAVIEPLRPASKEEVELIQSLIHSGLLQPIRKSGSVIEWKWKGTQKKVA